MPNCQARQKEGNPTSSTSLFVLALASSSLCSRFAAVLSHFLSLYRSDVHSLSSISRRSCSLSSDILQHFCFSSVYIVRMMVAALLLQFKQVVLGSLLPRRTSSFSVYCAIVVHILSLLCVIAACNRFSPSSTYSTFSCFFMSSDYGLHSLSHSLLESIDSNNHTTS